MKKNDFSNFVQTCIGNEGECVRVLEVKGHFELTYGEVTVRRKEKITTTLASQTGCHFINPVKPFADMDLILRTLYFRSQNT